MGQSMLQEGGILGHFNMSVKTKQVNQNVFKYPLLVNIYLSVAYLTKISEAQVISHRKIQVNNCGFYSIQFRIQDCKVL